MSIPGSSYSVAAILGFCGSEQKQTVSSLRDATSSRRRRSRTVYSKETITKMEELYKETQYPDIHQREKLSVEVGVPEARIQVWFQNRRSRNNKRRGDVGTSMGKTPEGKKRPRSKTEDDNPTSDGQPNKHTEPPVKILRSTEADAEVFKSLDASPQTTEKTPHYYLPHYYGNCLWYPYFSNPALENQQCAWLTAKQQNFQSFFPYTSSFYNMPPTPSLVLPSTLPQASLSPTEAPCTELFQTTRCQQCCNLSLSVLKDEYLMHKRSAECKSQMFVPPLKRAQRTSVTELISADKRAENGDSGDNESHEARLPSPPSYLKTENNQSLDSSHGSDAGFGQELSLKTW